MDSDERDGRSVVGSLPIETVLLDLDGTLIDSVSLILESYRHTTRIHLGRDIPDSHFLAGLGRPLHVEFATFTEDPAEIDAMVTTYREFNLDRHDQLVSEYPGAVSAVVRLVESGIRVGIVTSKLRETAQRGLDVAGFPDIFEVLIGSGQVDNHKPHPEPIHRALESMGVPAHTAVYVGDSPHDLVAGREAGTRTAAATWGPFDREQLMECDPDYVLDVPADLQSLLG